MEESRSPAASPRVRVKPRGSSQPGNETEEALRMSREELALRNRVLEKFLTIMDNRVYAKVLGVVLEALSSTRGFMGYLNEEGDLVCPTFSRGPGEFVDASDSPFIHRETTLPDPYREAFREKRIVVASRSVTFPEGHLPAGQCLLVPIVECDIAIGLMGLADKPEGYTDRDRELAATVASCIASILGSRLRRDREERDRRAAEARLQRLNEELERRVAERTGHLLRQIAERRRREAEILRLNEELETRVAERTSALEEVNGFLQTIIDTIPVPVFYKIGFRYAGCNAAFEEFSGYRRDMVMGAKARDLFPRWNADLFEEVDMDLFRHGGHRSYDAEATHPDGTIRQVVVHKAVFPRGVDHRVIVGVIHDVTESRLHEEALRKARNDLEARVIERTLELAETNLELRREIAERKQMEHQIRAERDKFRGILLALREGVCIIGPDHIVEFANDTIKEWFPGIEGSHCHHVFGPHVGYPCDCQGEAPAVNKEFGFHGRYFEKSASTFADVDHTRKRIVLLRDVTEKKLLQRDAMRSSHLASLGELAAGVAHEINNPVNGIINYAQLMIDDAEGSADTQASDLPARIIQEGERIARIVNNLLSFARGEEDEVRPAELRPIVEDALSLMAKQLQKEGIRIEIDIPQGLPLVLVNPLQIQQVFINLLSNARYALDQRFPLFDPRKRIKISAEALNRKDRQYVRCIFFDSGQGIAPDEMDKLCDPFFSTKPKGHGTGLGLSISFGILKGCGGEISFDSVPGEYTAVMVDLPGAAGAFGSPKEADGAPGA